MPNAVRSPAVGNSTSSPIDVSAGSTARLDDARRTVVNPLARASSWIAHGRSGADRGTRGGNMPNSQGLNVSRAKEGSVRAGVFASNASGGGPMGCRWCALPYRTTPLVDGNVSYISPDVLADKEGRPFFQVQIRPDPKSLSHANIIALDPGMAAEVYIQTQSRTALQYLMPLEWQYSLLSDQRFFPTLSHALLVLFFALVFSRREKSSLLTAMSRMKPMASA